MSRQGGSFMRQVIAGLCIWLALCASAHAEKRVALVIGNSAYAYTPALANPANDAEDIAAALTRLGFDITLQRDLTIADFDKAVDAFVTKAADADIAIFFYAGHGLQIDKRGFMAPVDAKVETESSALRELVAIQEVVSRIEHAAKVSVIVLDACRDSPLQERLRRVTRNRDVLPPKGLPSFSVTGSNTLVVYATVPSEVAKDGDGRNSPFTASLLKHVETPGLEIELMFKRVTKDVMQTTGGKQQPERLSRLQTELMLHAGPLPPGSVAPKQGREPTPDERAAAAKADGMQAALVVPPAKPQVESTAKPAVGVYPPDTAGRKVVESFRDCPKCPEMVVVPAGSFMMGSPENEQDRIEIEDPQHKVTIPKAFAVGKFTVTFDEWQACVDGGGCKSNKTPADEHWGRGRRPVIHVSLYDANEYIAWLSRKTGKTYRLLSEAEWEYAARAGTATRYFWGDENGNNRANCADCGSQWDRKQTAPVGSFAPNDFGLYDMHGNVWQRVKDCANFNYKEKPPALHQNGGAWTTGECLEYVMRGGAWLYNSNKLRSASRFAAPPDVRGNYIGFRVARTLTP
jgi:formylglycine-generating enzyme required for sulfatase activity